jgi:hypothetical protein
LNFFGRFVGAFLHGSEKTLLGAWSVWKSGCSLTVMMGAKAIKVGLLLLAVSTCGDKRDGLYLDISPNHLTTFTHLP